eukprot:scaffold61645_cov42-Phaeocystis_antarctica.AAC.1
MHASYSAVLAPARTGCAASAPARSSASATSGLHGCMAHASESGVCPAGSHASSCAGSSAAAPEPSSSVSDAG